MSKVYNDAKKTKNLCGKPVNKAYMTDLLQAIIDLGYRVDAVPVHGGWIEVDTVEDLISEYNILRLKKVSDVSMVSNNKIP
jgi:NDP-sugar pyrophosphorylase family protein